MRTTKSTTGGDFVAKSCPTLATPWTDEPVLAFWRVEDQVKSDAGILRNLLGGGTREADMCYI